MSKKINNVDNLQNEKNKDNYEKDIEKEKSIQDEYFDNFSAIRKYEEEWLELFDIENIINLRQKAQTGTLRASRFRSVCWRVMLDVLPEDNSEWPSYIRNTRCHYSKLKAQMTMDPRKNSYIEDNPLSQNSRSVWYQHFCDTELRVVIRQDVDRTFPGIEFFRKEYIQNIMVDILFIYARVHPVMCYRQGMHEILAPLLFVIHCDQQAMLHTIEQGELSVLIQEVLNPEYLEEDAYALFENIMNGIEFCYNIKDLEPTNTGYFPSYNTNSPSVSAIQNQNENEIISRLKYIRDYILKHHDPELCTHLNTLDITFSLFGIRWLRLLFGREFPLQDLLVLWDAIFAEGKSFDFINYIVVAMLITIRSQLLNSDYTYCLTYLMRYPTITDIMYIINYALYLRNPQLRSPPNTVNHVQSHMLLKPDENKTMQDNKTQKRIVGKRVSKLKNQSINVNKIPRSETESYIVEGFTLHDPEVLRVELNHAHNVMALCQIKLIQYHKTLKKSLPNKDSEETQKVLDGICELCHLLRSRYYVQNHSTSQSVEVEPALEAGESKLMSPLLEKQQLTLAGEGDQLKKTDKISAKPKNQNGKNVSQKTNVIVDSNTPTSVNLSKRSITAESTKSEFYIPLNLKMEEPLKVFAQVVGVNGAKIQGAPLCDPLEKIKVFCNDDDTSYFMDIDVDINDIYLRQAVSILNYELEDLRIK